GDTGEGGRGGGGKARGPESDRTGELAGDGGEKGGQGIAADGRGEGGGAVADIVEELCPPITMDSTEDEIIRRMQVRASLAMILERARLEAVEGPVREQFEEALHALTAAEHDPTQPQSPNRPPPPPPTPN